LTSLGHPCKFLRVSRLGSVTAATSLTGGQPNFARCLAVSWPGTLYINFRDLLPPDGILPRAKFTLRSCLALPYIGSVAARHSSSGHQPNFAVLSRRRHLYSAGRPWITLYEIYFIEILVGVRAIQDSTIRFCWGCPKGPPWIGGFATTLHLGTTGDRLATLFESISH